MTRRPVVVLTGGPCGGKSTLQEELAGDPAWRGGLAFLPEAVQYARHCGINPRERLFQRVVVQMQIGLEEALERALGEADRRPIVCHRGSLDPLAFWRLNGWETEEFFRFTGMTRAEHYERYEMVIHLVTAAEGAEEAYRRWPEAHRPEEAEMARVLDGFLREAWGGHPNYHILDNCEVAWKAKAERARRLLDKVAGKRRE